MATLIKYGTYAGNGVDNRAITGVGFQPNLVVIAGGANRSVIRSSSMAGDLTETLTGNLVGFADGIQSLDADGFTVGTDATVNANGTTYFWLAIKTSAGESAVLSYTGNGLDGRQVTGVGFLPTCVVVWNTTEYASACWRTVDFPASTGCPLDQASGTNLVQSFIADGFTVGTSSRVNTNAKTYYAFCVKDIASVFDTIAYTGDGTDNRAITGLGFQPDGVWVHDIGGGVVAIHRFKDDAGDSTHYMNATAPAADLIQSLDADGFTVGTLANVSARTYKAIGFKTAAGISTYYQSLAATAVASGVLTKVATFPRSLTVTAVGLAVLTRQATYSLSLAATAIGQAILTKLATFYRSLAATVLGQPTLQKKMFVPLTATAQGLPTVALIGTFARTLSVVGSANVVLTKIVTYVSPHINAFIRMLRGFGK